MHMSVAVDWRWVLSHDGKEHYVSYMLTSLPPGVSVALGTNTWWGAQAEVLTTVLT